MKRILFRGDDAGGCVSANEAIVEAFQSGVLRNVSVMACGPAFDAAVPMLQELSGVCLGLHMVLNAEWEGPRWGPVLPAARVPTLLEKGTGYFTHFPKDLPAQNFSVDEAIAETYAQLTRMRDAGLNPVYLDQHMGVGGLPGLPDAVADLCRREGLIDASTVSFNKLPPPATPEDASLIDRWLSSLGQAGHGVYRIVTHPGKDAPDMQAYFLPGGVPGVVARERDAERIALCDPRLRDSLDAASILSVRYDEVQTL